MTSTSIGLSSNIHTSHPLTHVHIHLTIGDIIAKTMQTALVTNVSVSDVIIYNSVVENVIKSGLTSLSISTSSNANSNTISSSISTTLTLTDKTNIQNLYESYVDSIGQMSMKAISKGQVTSISYLSLTLHLLTISIE